MAIYSVAVRADLMGEDCINVWYVEGTITDRQQLADDIAANIYFPLLANTSQDLTYQDITIRNVDGSEIGQVFQPATWPAAGEIIDQSMPSVVAAYATFRGTTPAYPATSRKYFGGIPEQGTGGNVIGSGFVAAMQSLVDAVLAWNAASTDGVQFVCYRPLDDATNVIASGATSTAVATMRSRRPGSGA